MDKLNNYFESSEFEQIDFTKSIDDYMEYIQSSEFEQNDDLAKSINEYIKYIQSSENSVSKNELKNTK